MRILHVVHQYLPDQVGGTELYTHWIAHHLAQRGHQVDIFYRRAAAGTGVETRLEAHGTRVWAAQAGQVSPTGRFLATFGEKQLLDSFRQVVLQVKPDLVHLQHLMGLPIAIVDFLQRHNLPFVVTLHDYWWVCANAQLLTNYSRQLCDGPQAYLNCARCVLARTGYPDRFWPVLPLLAGPLAWRNHHLRRALNWAETLIAPTQFVGRWYIDHGISPQKIRVIPHGLDSPPALTQTSQNEAAPFRFAYIGGLSWQKGVHILLEAFANINNNAELWIAGDESADPDYVSRLRMLAGPDVRFLGKLPREKVWDTLRQVDVVVLPSLWYETFSFIVSEAFAAGVPVVASKIGPLAERVSDGVNGLLVPPNQPQALAKSLRRVLQEPELLGQLQAGIGPVYTFEEHVTELEAVYRQALK